MNGEVKVDLSTIPMNTLIVVFIGIAGLLIIAAVLIKIFKIDFGFSKKDTIKLQDYEYDQRCILINHKIKEDVDNIDWNLQKSLREQTKNINCVISELDIENSLCKPSRISLFKTIKEPLYACVSNNHFTREFMPTNYDSYRKNIISSMQNDYKNLMYEYNGDACEKNTLETWSVVEPIVEKSVDTWLIMAMNEVKKACYQKLNLYKTEIKNVEKSETWKSVIQNCIDKNTHYIDEIEKRLSKYGG